MENFWLILVSISFMLCGIFIILTEKNVTLSCRRDASKPPSCELIRSGITGSQTLRFPLESLKGAILESFSFIDEEVMTYTYRIVLVIHANKTPLSKSFDNRYKSKKKFVDLVNYFLNNPEEKVLFAEEKFRWSVYIIFGPFFILMGIFMLASTF